MSFVIKGTIRPIRAHNRERAEEALNNFVYGCLNKPFDLEGVLRLLKEIRERRQTA